MDLFKGWIKQIENNEKVNMAIINFLSKKTANIKNLNPIGPILAFIFSNLISMHLLLQTLRSFIIAPAIITELIPILLAILGCPIVAFILSEFLDDSFLALTGGLTQSVGRTLLLINGGDQNINYLIGMSLSFSGHLLFFVGTIGTVLKRYRFKNETEDNALNGNLIFGFIFGSSGGFGLNLLLRFPGINAVEDVFVNIMLLIAFSIVLIVTYGYIEREHNVIKNLPDLEDYQGKVEITTVLKPSHLYILAPCQAVLSFLFIRPEYLSAVSNIEYQYTTIILILLFLISPVIYAIIPKGKNKIYGGIKIISICFATVGVGLMYYLPRGAFILVLSSFMPLSACLLTHDVLNIARNGRTSMI
ncbi:MAG: hypothetical protein ACTSWN_10575, partial [Promethearchaeota archaeon]